eukprot:gene25957-31779_t
MDNVNRRINAVRCHLNGSVERLPGAEQLQVLPTSHPIPSYDTITAELTDGIAVVTLNRPKALNALNSATMKDVVDAMQRFDADPAARVIVLTGAGRAFAAGADIKEMQSKSLAESYATNFLAGWELVYATKKPIIGAINGFALGGGCELAMMCDILIASEAAVFGQPEIKLGILPGMGGSQRLTRAIGKSRAMEMILTGNPIKAPELAEWGLVSRVVPAAELMDTVMKMAKSIAAQSTVSAMMAKEAVKQAYESSLQEGLHFERRTFHSAFGLKDQKEGMAAFVGKRKA